MRTRTVPEAMNSTVRHSAQAGISQSARRVRPNSDSPSFLAPRLPARELSGVVVSTRAGQLESASCVGEQGEQEGLNGNFNELEERLQQHLDRQKQCLRDISHELRSPISRIRVLLERARRSPQESCGYLTRIEGNVLRMEALTRKLLDFSRLEAVEEPFVKERCDLAEIVFRVVEDARIEAEARGCIVKYSLIPSCPVYANYELLHRAVENVVRNSVQYTREKSSVSVVLSCTSNEVAQILVEDEGPGISEKELKNVFKPFYRAAHPRAKGTLGVGLGLAISEQAVKLHRGSINACNRSDGKGLQVRIEIPLLNKCQGSAGQLGHNSANWNTTVDP